MIKQIFFGVFFLFSGSLFCQIYGELNIPAKCNEMPNWAKLMYDEPINFIQLAKEYRSYYKEKPFEKNQYTRYYKRLIMNYRTAMDERGNAIPIDIEIGRAHV